MIQNSLYTYMDGVGKGNYTDSLPTQTLPDSKKGLPWQKSVMDRLETIGLGQITRNLEFRDYYKMVEGRLVYSDFEPAPEIMRDITALRSDMDLPTYIKHYDLIGVITNLLVGELDSNKDKLRVDSTDEFSENEYIRAKSQVFNEYQKEKFDMEVKRGLAMKGINPEENKKFNSPEEKQQFLQFIQAESNKIVSLEYRQKDLNKNFKVQAVEWAEGTLESDTINFGINHLEEKEFIDYFLTGRFFRHYHVGYDYYKPESWRVEETFFSQDSDTEYPQNGEYVGRVKWMSGSDILSRFGSELPLKLQEKIGNTFSEGTENSVGSFGDITRLDKRAVGQGQVPHVDYLDHQMNVQLQEAFGVPGGVSTYKDKDGNDVESPDWLSTYDNNQTYLGGQTARLLRDDIDVRTDLFRVTEAYFRSRKRMGYLRYRTPSGIVAEELVDDTLLREFLKENSIKKIKSISLDDFEKTDEVNVICYFYVPEIWKGRKIGAGNGILDSDIYFGIEPLEYQIKGNGNMFDVLLPDGGIITNSQARKLRPYQLGYNLCMNQIYNLLEREIGMFFLMDINFLPSEFKDMGDSAEILSELRDLARDIGFLPVDTSRQNLQGTNPQAGAFQRQEISYDAQINRRAVMADMYKRLILEQIGITEQRKGNPSEYATNEGIKVGQEASYAQTKMIYSRFNEARRLTSNLHLTVAQFCQQNNKDVTLYSRKSDGDLAYLNFADDLFQLRDLGVTLMSDAKSRKSLETLRQQLLTNNTAGSDILDFAEIMNSDSMIELVATGQRSRAKAEKELQDTRTHEKELVDKQIEGAAVAKEVETKNVNKEAQKDRENRLEVERVKAIGRAADKDGNQEDFDEINRAADFALKERTQDSAEMHKDRELDIKEEDAKTKQINAQEALRVKLAELKDKRAQRKHEMTVAIVNKN